MSLENGPFWWLTIKGSPPTATEKAAEFLSGCGCLLIVIAVPVAIFVLGWFCGSK